MPVGPAPPSRDSDASVGTRRGGERGEGYRDAAQGDKPSPNESREIRGRIRARLQNGMNPDDVADQLVRGGHDPEWARSMVEKIDVALEHAATRSLERRRRGRLAALRGADPDDLGIVERQATTVLVFGVLTFTVCMLFAPVAWLSGNHYIARCRELDVEPRGIAVVGRILGICGTALLGLFAMALLVGVCGVL